MGAPRARAVDFRRGWLNQLGALAALLGFLFTATSPGLALVATASPAVTVTGILDVLVCRAKSTPPDAVPSAGTECCLVCQVAQMADGALAPSAPQPSPPRALAEPLPPPIVTVTHAAVQGHARARAPPV